MKTVERQIELGSAFRCARKSRQLSVSRASRLLGVSPATVKRWESGKGVPPSPELETCLDHFGVPADSPLRETIRARRTRNTRDSGGRPLLRLLRAKRRRSGLSLEEVSAATGFSLASLHRYETGERSPDSNSLRLIASSVGCDQTEADLLCCTADAGQVTNPLVPRFLSAGTQPHFWLYHDLDACTAGYESTETLADVIHGCMLMGDHLGALEAWTLLKPVAQSADLSEERKAVLGLSLTLARLSTGNGVDGVALRVAKWCEVLSSLELSYESAQAMLHLVRVLSSLGQFEEAELWLGRADSYASKANDAGTMFVCELSRLALTFHRTGSCRVLDRLIQLRSRSTGQVQAYTADVAALEVLAQSGSADELNETLERCRELESQFGVGSPLAKRIGQTQQVRKLAKPLEC